MLLPDNLTIADLDDMVEKTGGHPRDVRWRQDRPLTVREARDMAKSEDPDDLRCAARQLRHQAMLWEMLGEVLLRGRPEMIAMHDSAGSGVKEVRTLLEIEAELKVTLGDVGLLIQQRQQIEALASKMRGAAAICEKAASEIDASRFARFAQHYARIIEERENV